MRRPHPFAVLFLLCGPLLGLSLVGCEDDPPKGDISHGPATDASSAKQEAKRRLIYAPGSPLATMPVAKVFTKRLEPLGLDRSHIKIGGENIHVDVPLSKAAQVKKALDGGRLDIFLFDDRTDPFAGKADELADGYQLGSETIARADGGEEVVHFLVAPGAQRQALDKLLGEHGTGSKGLIGPAQGAGIAPGSVRSYYVQSAHSVRGELLKAAVAEADSKDGALLVLTFEGSGKNLLRWSSKDRARFVVQIDGDVVGAAQPAAEVTDGVLRVTLAGSGAAARAEQLAKVLNVGALSHLTVFDEERDAPRAGK